jgi:hypothetical protein
MALRRFQQAGLLALTYHPHRVLYAGHESGNYLVLSTSNLQAAYHLGLQWALRDHEVNVMHHNCWGISLFSDFINSNAILFPSYNGQLRLGFRNGPNIPATEA